MVEYVSKDVKLTVTASPVKGMDATLTLTERLAGHGFAVVPHLAARLIVDDAHLTNILHRLQDVGLRDVFVIAGDAERPAGKFAAALDLLVAMQQIGHRFNEIGIAGYPESHPFIDDDVTIQAMWDKRQFATYIVSNMCFNPNTIIRWAGRVRRRGVELPLYIGMPGPIERLKLMRVASKIGIGESARFLRLHKNWVLRLALPGSYSPRRLLTRLVWTEPAYRIRGVHVYTFNAVEETERWRRKMLERLEPAT